jgi:hypothetical protein
MIGGHQARYNEASGLCAQVSIHLIVEILIEVFESPVAFAVLPILEEAPEMMGI